MEKWTVKWIMLTQGRMAKVDDDVYEYLSQLRWRAHRHRHCYYAVRQEHKAEMIARCGYYDNSKRLLIGMHAAVLDFYGIDHPEDIDHVDGDGLNNQRFNLRACTHRENLENRYDQSVHGVGVYLKPSGRYRAMAWINGKNRYLGMFDTAEEAQAARKEVIDAHQQ
jgi:hypothetical protein